MGEILRVLQVEDSESDAALIVRLLEKAGYDVDSRRVDDSEKMRDALQPGYPWDVIIADHRMDRFDAAGALRILHETGRDIPFIVVSGSIGDEQAVTMMKSGAHDYVLKDRLARLVPAVQRELREARSRRDRRHVERDLAESQERLALAIQATSLGTFDYSPPTGSMIWSEMTCRHFGLPPDAEVSYDTFMRGIHPDDRGRVHTTVQDLLLPGSTGRYAIEYRSIGIADGVERQISSWGRVFFDPAGLASRFVGVTLDISERKRLEDQFRQAQKLESVGRLAGGVAHDFNNILTVINGYSDLLLSRLPAGDPLHEPTAAIRAAGERGAALSRQLLFLSRKQVVQPKEVNLNEIIVEIQKMLGRMIGEDIRLESSLCDQLGHVMADPGQLHQILMNLAVNARDAMPGGGTLLIETGNIDLGAGFVEQQAGLAPGRYVELKVSDTGTGMTKEVISHLFEPFFTTKKPGKGTGLGLATIYGIIKQYGGLIQVQSEPGRGTMFTIYLPWVAAGAKSVQEPKPVPPRGTETVLIVEDQEQLRRLAGSVLRGYGYRVLEAAHPEDALVQSENYQHPIHLMLSDVVMPGMTGPELAVRMKPLRPDMQVVFMSGYSEPATLGTWMLETDGAFLAKPFSPAALALKVREVLGTRAVAGIAAHRPRTERSGPGR